MCLYSGDKLTAVSNLENYLPRSIYDEIQILRSVFNLISFQHVYRERNGEADVLSKAELQLDLGVWHVQTKTISPLHTFTNQSFDLFMWWLLCQLFHSLFQYYRFWIWIWSCWGISDFICCFCFWGLSVRWKFIWENLYRWKETIFGPYVDVFCVISWTVMWL